MKKKRIGLYPGSFDPVTNGHLDIIFRAHKLVDELVIGVAHNQKKENLFSMKKRKELILHEIKKSKFDNKNFKVVIFDGLLMNFAKSINANLIVRGLRAVSDFDYEFQMALTNRVIIGFHDMVRGRMHRRQHLGKFVEIRQIIQCWIAPHIVQIAQVWRACHGYEHGMPLAKGQVMFGITRVIGEFRGDR